MAKKSSMTFVEDFAFYEQLWNYYASNRGKIRSRYNDLTKKFLAYNDRNENPDAFLRTPQFEALEMYVFIKEFMNNAHMFQMFDDWRNHRDKFSDVSYYTIHKRGQITLLDLGDEQNEAIFKQMKKYRESYPNYIYALTMGLGKTILMGTCIFYEFLLANKYPKDKRFCHNALSLVGEISRYMNLSCVLISRILSEAIDGFDNLVEAVNKHNEVLDDVIIPKIFNTLYEVKSEQKNEDVDVILLKEPKDSGYYEFSADENLVIEKDYNSFTPEEIKKSFHADTYCFDSKPEKECFLQYISSKKVKEIYFTGMFTANQGDLFVQYYDPESKRIRQYYPDFLAKMNDGSYQLIEVKGDNMIDDEVVKAKAEAAEEMSVASGMKYVMYASSVLMKQNVLEHPPVTYSEEPSPLLMVAEDPVPYGK